LLPANVIVRPWKALNPEPGFPDTWPRYRSPDVFVDNDGNRQLMVDTSVSPAFRYYANVDLPGEPQKGRSDNRLFAWIRNIGNSKAENVEVSFSYSPYGIVGGVGMKQHFKPIVSVKVDLDASGAPGAEKEIEVSWDLSDLSEDNGGLWPKPLSYFYKFCVKIEVSQPGVPPRPPVQHNFSNVVSSTSLFTPMPITIANSEREVKRCELTAQRLPATWRLLVRGLGGGIAVITSRAGARFDLKPGEEKHLTLIVVAGDMSESQPQSIEVTLLMDNRPVGGFSFATNSAVPRVPISLRSMLPTPSRIIRRSPPVRFNME
jgi:hypothetical protein